MIFPSLFEGFGMPILEAMACGCPVACSNTTSCPEVAGDAALLFDPLDSEAIAEAIHALVTDADLRNSLRKRGLARVQEFQWKDVIAQHEAVYRRAAAL
jgi:alpha-1,3-rhamnosyl/mannosyltransferase